MGVDLIVRGAGVFGLCCAYAAARRGARVAVADPGGVGAGASGGVLGALAPHVPGGWNAKKAFQFESLVMSRAFWPEVEARSGLPTGYAATGRLQAVVAGGEALARAREADARACWGDAAVWEVVPAAGGWEPASDGWLVRDTLSAHLDPARACAALAGAVRALGGTIGAEAEGPVPVIHATGVAGLAALSEGRARAAGAPVHGQAARLALDRAGAPQLFAGGLHVVPHLDGTVAVGSTSEAGRTDAEVDGALEEVIARARAAVPDLRGARVIARWAGVRPRARTRAPILGAWPGRPGHWIANGGFKIGFGMAPLVGEVMADLVLKGRDRVPEGLRVADALGGQDGLRR